jgi:tetratricopeptide (TPR) repeat protein
VGVEAQILEASKSGNHFAAIHLAKQFISENSTRAEGYLWLARATVAGGNRRKALAPALEAVRIEPNNSQYLYYAGWLYQDFRLYEYALPLLIKALALNPKNAIIHETVAQCYSQIGRSDAAAKHFKEAILLTTHRSKKDKYSISLARHLMTSNKRHEAETILKSIIKRKSTLSTQAIAELALFTNDSPASEIGQLVQALLAEATLTPEVREKLLLAMGRMHDNVMDYDSAFDYWSRSRSIAMTLIKTADPDSDRIKRQISYYSEATLAIAQKYGCPDDGVILVVGMPRSGTTLVEQIVASHTKADGVGEIARWNIIDAHFQRQFPNLSSIEETAKRGQIRERGREIVTHLRALSTKSVSHIVEKTPHNFLCLGYFLLCLPKVKVIHMVRNPCDTFISTYQNLFNRSHPYAYDQVRYAGEYNDHLIIMNHWKRLSPQNIITVNYEELVAEPENEMKRVFEFLELNWEPDSMNFFRSDRAVRTFSTQQVRQPVNANSLFKWQNYRKHLDPLLKQLQTYPWFELKSIANQKNSISN